MLSFALDLIDDQLSLVGHTFLFTLENPFGSLPLFAMMKNHPLVKSQLEASRASGGLGAVRCVLDYCKFCEHCEGAGPQI